MKKKLSLFIFLFSGLYALAMERGEKFSQEENTAVAKLMQIKYAAGEISPRRTKHQVVAPNIKKQHREARNKAKVRWTAEHLKSIKKILFPDVLNG